MAVSKDPIQPPLLPPKSDLLSLPSPPSPGLLDYFSRKYLNEYLVVTIHDLLWVRWAATFLLIDYFLRF